MTFNIIVDDSDAISIDKDMGEFPIMVKSNLCHLYQMKPRELVKVHEEPWEQGGYFICNGIERVIRMLQVKF